MVIPRNTLSDRSLPPKPFDFDAVSGGAESGVSIDTTNEGYTAPLHRLALAFG
jgi:hypothetical protein